MKAGRKAPRGGIFISCGRSHDARRRVSSACRRTTLIGVIWQGSGKILASIVSDLIRQPEMTLLSGRKDLSCGWTVSQSAALETERRPPALVKQARNTFFSGGEPREPRRASQTARAMKYVAATIRMRGRLRATKNSDAARSTISQSLALASPESLRARSSSRFFTCAR